MCRQVQRSGHLCNKESNWAVFLHVKHIIFFNLKDGVMCKNKLILKASRYKDDEVDGVTVSIDPEGGDLVWGERIYLYPDMDTGLAGDFTGGQMWSAGPAEDVSVRVDSDTDTLEVTWTQVRGHEYCYAPSGLGDFGDSDPRLRDPYEDRHIAVRTSCFETGGQGVFAKVKLYSKKFIDDVKL